MKHSIVILLLMIFGLPFVDGAQKKFKPWDEWSKKDAEKILNDSPWGQTQTETDISEMFFRLPAAPTAQRGSSNPNPDPTTPDERGGATHQATSVKYHVRFLSAKPIRQAIARFMEIEQPIANNKVRVYMRDFVERNFDRWIAVTVTAESQDQRYLGQANQVFASAVSEVLKNNTYLERKDGKRVFLQIYQPPSPDGLGAKFIFPRQVDGKTFLHTESREVRFVSEVSSKIKLNIRFNVDEMIYDGELEY